MTPTGSGKKRWLAHFDAHRGPQNPKKYNVPGKFVFAGHLFFIRERARRHPISDANFRRMQTTRKGIKFVTWTSPCWSCPRDI
jgi:hypothetical protein